MEMEEQGKTTRWKRRSQQGMKWKLGSYRGYSGDIVFCKRDCKGLGFRVEGVGVGFSIARHDVYGLLAPDFVPTAMYVTSPP